MPRNPASSLRRTLCITLMVRAFEAARHLPDDTDRNAFVPV